MVAPAIPTELAEILASPTALACPSGLPAYFESVIPMLANLSVSTASKRPDPPFDPFAPRLDAAFALFSVRSGVGSRYLVASFLGSAAVVGFLGSSSFFEENGHQR